MASAKLAFLGKAGRVKQVGRVAQICLPIKYKEGVISLRVVLMNMWDSTQLHGANYPLTQILFRDWRHCVLFTNSLRSHDTVCLLVQKIRFPRAELYFVRAPSYKPQGHMLIWWENLRPFCRIGMASSSLVPFPTSRWLHTREPLDRAKRTAVCWRKDYLPLT